MSRCEPNILQKPGVLKAHVHTMHVNTEAATWEGLTECTVLLHASSRILNLAFLGIGSLFLSQSSTETLVFRFDLTAEIANTLILLVGLHFAGVLEAHIHTVYLYSLTIARKGLTQYSVFLNGRLHLLEGEFLDVATPTNLITGYRCAEMASTLCNDLRVAAPEAVGTVHDGVPQGKFEVADELHNTLKLLCRDETTSHGEESPITHTCPNCVAMEHTSGELVAWRPRVAICMWAALVCLIQVAVLRRNIGMHCLANNEVALPAEFNVLWAAGSKLGVDELWAHVLEELEK